MRNIKFRTTLILLAILSATLIISLTFSSLMSSVVIRNSGQISLSSEKTIPAKSGSAEDIQTAVDAAEAAGGGTVIIPEGTFDFDVTYSVDARYYGRGVEIPGGVNVIGMGDNNTVLKMYNSPYPGLGGTGTGAQSFFFWLDGANGKPIRISGITFIGYREFDPTNIHKYGAINIRDTTDFRVDHCLIRNLCGAGVYCDAGYLHTNRGVIDHCDFINWYGICEDPATGGVYDLGYAVANEKNSMETYDPDITHFLGKYNLGTVFVEDCYFERWRHLATNSGGHTVIRYCRWWRDWADGSVDAHSNAPSGCRCLEVYNNRFENPIHAAERASYGIGPSPIYAILIRGGSGVIYNNYIDFHDTSAMYLCNENSNPNWWTKQMWIWNNTYINISTPILTSGPVQDTDYFLRQPNVAQDGFTYTPYPYPHPLTL